MAASTVRYRVLLLTFLTAFLMYVDRVCIGTAAPYISNEFGFDKTTMGFVFSAFSLGYALFQIPGGWAADKFGPRKILMLSVAWWSVFTAATAAAFSAVSMGTYRFLFGIGEAAAFPAGSRALVRWLPVRQRAFGQGFQHAGSRFGAAITPPVVVLLIGSYGWRAVFYIFGAFGVVWAILWFTYYRDYPEEHPGVNQEELQILAESGFSGKRSRPLEVPWERILRSKQPVGAEPDVLLLRLGAVDVSRVAADLPGRRAWLCRYQDGNRGQHPAIRRDRHQRVGRMDFRQAGAPLERSQARPAVRFDGRLRNRRHWA